MMEFALVLPEVYLAATVVGLILGESAQHGERTRLVLPTALLGLAGAFIQCLLLYKNSPMQILGGTLAMDGFSIFFRLVLLVLAGITVTSACLGRDVDASHRSEYCATVLLGTLGLMIAAAASNLFVAALALQLAGACGWLLAGIGRRDHRSAEGGIKWLVYSMCSGVFLLLGATATQLLAGSANIYEIHRAFAATEVSALLTLAIFAALFVGLAIPMLAFPAQFWAPDVMQGVGATTGGFLILGMRAGALAVAARIWMVVFASPAANPGKYQVLGSWDWTSWLGVCAALTLILPALLSIRQTDAKRLLACIASVQTGFTILGLLILEELGLAAVLFNIVVDLLAFGGMMAVLALREEPQERRPGILEPLAFTLFALSWLGLPPFAGFIARFALIGAAVRREWYILSMLALVSLALVMVAAFRLLLRDFNFRASDQFVAKPEMADGGASPRRIFILSMLVPLVGASLFAEGLLRWAGHSLRFIFW